MTRKAGRVLTTLDPVARRRAAAPALIRTALFPTPPSDGGQARYPGGTSDVRPGPFTKGRVMADRTRPRLVYFFFPDPTRPRPPAVNPDRPLTLVLTCGHQRWCPNHNRPHRARCYECRINARPESGVL
jgi:hypothetical protein